jgi:hypothetical protein
MEKFTFEILYLETLLIGTDPVISQHAKKTAW